MKIRSGSITDNAFRIHFKLGDFTKVRSWKNVAARGGSEHLLELRVQVVEAQFHSFQGVDNRSHSREESDTTATASSPLSLSVSLSSFTRI